MKLHLFFILILFSAVDLFSQLGEDRCYHCRVDSGYFFSFILQPDIQLSRFEYYFSSKTDTLIFRKYTNGKSTLLKMKMDRSMKNFMINEGVKTLEQLKFDETHVPQVSAFSILIDISHNFTTKAVFIEDHHYLKKMLIFLNQFNQRIPQSCRFPADSFSHNPLAGKTISKDTIFSIEQDYGYMREHKKDKYIVNRSKNKETFDLTYFDSIQQKKINSLPLVFKATEKAKLQKLCFDYANTFSYEKKLFKRTIIHPEIFIVIYTIPGLMIQAHTNSIEKAKKDKKSIQLLNTLNANLEKKYEFN